MKAPGYPRHPTSIISDAGVKRPLNKLSASFCVAQGLTCNDLDCLPFGVAAPIREALHQSAADPPLTLPRGAYELIGEYA